MGNFGYAKVGAAECADDEHHHWSSQGIIHNRTLRMCVKEYRKFTADLDHDELVLNISGTKR